ncbi:MAG: zinc ribbon domain-containing protein [Clostridiales bacterium]|nr:zinc ribbon domain-containing protein [Eubacteriales bacterium]MDH7567221.1 zinc ribbon domain-containing protein [Clostridiales bacterium]
MKKFDEFIERVNFRKVTKVYIILSIVLLAISVAGTAYFFREKIIFTMDYFKIHRQVEENGIGDSIKPQLDKLANASSDIKDILLLDKENNIVYKSKNSDIGKNNKLVLNLNKDNRKFLEDANDPNVFYKLVRPERLILSKESIKKPREVEEEYDDEYFYNTNFNAKKVYLLNYLVDKRNGMKVFIISDIKAMPYAEQLLETIGGLLSVIFFVYWVLLALWVYKDAGRRYLNAALWGLLVLVTNIVGLIVYLLFKQNNQTCYKCGALQSRSDVFCSICGTKINKSCEKCGNIVVKNDKYCSKCGEKLN